MSEKNVYVATYGSLRKGMGNYRVNESAGAEFFGSGKTKNKVALFRYCEGFPSISLTHPSDSHVVVDVFKTDQNGLEGAYDSLEGYRGKGHPYNFYDRTEVPIVMDDGSEITAWIYHIDEVTGPQVEHGDWCKYKADN